MVIRKQIQKFTGEPTKVDLEKITQLRIWYNQPSDLSDLKELTQLTMLDISGDPDLTKTQITELQKALPKCEIKHNAKK